MQTRKLTEVPISEFSKETNFVVEIDEEMKRVRSSDIRRLVTDEKDRAQGAEKNLADGINAETARAVGAEKTLTDNLSAEATRAKAAEQTLAADLGAEASRAREAETILTDNLSAEVSRAKAAEQTLTDNLAAEIARAGAAEKANADNLEAEVTRAKAGEKAVLDSLSAEITRAEAKEGQISLDLADEVTRAKMAEEILTDHLAAETTRAEAREDGIAADLSGEISRAMDSENELSENLAAETTRAETAEKVLTDNLAVEAARAKAAEKANADSITAESNRAKAKETELQGSIQTEAGRATAAEDAIRNTITTNKPNWDDKYTRNEVDNKFSALETATDWKEAVNTFADLATTYPRPEDGWTVNVKDTDYTYRWSGTGWIAISANAIPKATQSVDGLLSKEDKAALDDTNAKKHIHSNMSTLDKLTEALLANWTDAYNKSHEHGNKSVIDKITQTLLDNWSAAYTHISDAVKHITETERANWNDANSKKHTHANKGIIDKLTQAMLDKLSGIAAGAEVNVQSDWSVTDTASDAFIKNKPTSMPAADVAAWAKAATKPSYGWTEITGKPSSYTPTTHSHTKNQITDMPTKVSQFTNDAGYITQADVDTSQNHTHSNKIVLDKVTQAMLDKLSGIASGAEVNVQADWSVTDTASDAYIKNKPSAMPASDVQAWAKAASKPAYGWTEITGKPSTFTPASHSHTNLAAINITGQTVDVNSYNLSSGSPQIQFYSEKTSGGAANITNIPVTGQPFLLKAESLRWASATDYITKQTFLSATAKATYERYCTNGTWGSWLPIAFFNATPVSGRVLVSDGTVGGIKSSAYTIAASVPSGAKFTDTVYVHPNSGAAAGTYRSVNVNAQGHVTAGTNPTTLAGYGITDAADKNHTHTKNQITDFPASLKNPAALTISLNGTSQGAYDGSAAKAFNITASSVGAAAGSHNHDSAYVKKTSRTLTLTAAGWSSSYPYTQTITVSGVAASDDIKVLGVYVPADATLAQVKAWNKAAGCLMCNPDGVAEGKITFRAYKKPAVDFQIITEGG